MMKGKFIVIEGLDGSGKSVQMDLLAEHLRNNGREVLVTSEPTKNFSAGITIRKVLRGELTASPMERQEWFIADRVEHLKNEVIPTLRQGAWVLMSRYVMSTIAYGCADGLDMRVLMQMNESFLPSDATIFIAVSPQVCIRRIEERGQAKELFEQRAKLEQVGAVYRQLAVESKSVYTVNGEQSPEDVARDIRQVIESL